MQDIYKQRSNWKIILAIVGALILIITLIYSNFLAKKLEKSELSNAAMYSEALLKVDITSMDSSDVDYNEDITFQLAIINSFSQPVIFKGDDGKYSGYNIPDDKLQDQEYLKSKINDFLKSGKKPYLSAGYHKEIYIFNTPLLDYIRWYPLLQIFLVGSFVGLGYFLFSSSKRAEQNRVWAGMAKETAHQLGTPISAIMGWVSYLKDSYEHDEVISDVAMELEKDVERLNLVADRFSKIGSAPDLQEKNLATVLTKVADYMQRRASRATIFEVNIINEVSANINDHLFEWVIENLIRNSLDSMDGKGSITIVLYTENNMKCIDIKDTGKGIPISKFKTIFNPGYSTKERGWGLGLSLAKRIIEEYHNGKIFVKESKIDIGTTFTIKLS
jgi:hypothetical protein